MTPIGETAADLVIVGGGLAGVSLIRALRERGDDRSIVVLAAELGDPYDRPPLSKGILTGHASTEDIRIASLLELASLGVRWKDGQRAIRLSEDQLQVTTQDVDSGVLSQWSGSDIVIATGAVPRLLAGFDADILTLRTKEDAHLLRDRLVEGARVVVVGGGFIGLEVASSAREMGCDVIVLETAQAPLSRVLGDGMGEWFIEFHQRNGVEILCGVDIRTIWRSSGGQLIEFTDGKQIQADVIVAGIGVLPQVDWLADSGIEIGDGVICDSQGRTTRDHVWAIGDVAAWPHPMTGDQARVEQWQAAVDQARAVAESLGGHGVSWDAVPYFWSDQHEQKIQFAGRPTGDVRVYDLDSDSVAAVFADDGLAVGMLVVGKPRLLALGRRMISQAKPVGAVEELIREAMA